MSYVIVHVQFPGVTVEQRNEIYKGLESRGWKKIYTIEIDSSTIWQQYSVNVLESKLMEKAKDDFTESSKNYTSPRLIVHAGSSPAKVIESLEKEKR